MSLLIKNGRLLDPASSIDTVTDILIENGKIKEIAPGIGIGDSHEVIDASGLLVSPGFIDIHVHLREPGQEEKEDIESGSRSAVRGGFTSIACMPNTSPVNDNVGITRTIIQRARDVGLVNIHPVAAVSTNLKSEGLTDMAGLVAEGVVAFSDDGRCVMNEALAKKAMTKAAALSTPVMEHAEDHDISQNGQVNDGPAARQCGLKGIPSASEDVIVRRDIRLQEETGAHLHITHISTAGAVSLVKDAKKQGRRVTSDVTPHHLLLDDESLDGCDTVYKMKPPLRSARDRKALVSGIIDGSIDCIATDHAPHTRSEKKLEFSQAPFGVIGMETAFPVVYDRLVRNGKLDLEQMIRLFSTNPAAIINLTDRGMVKPGLPADLTILDLERPFKVDAADFRSKADNCPFIGWEGKGAVAYTIVSGKVVYKSL